LTKTESSNPNPRSEKQRANGRKDLPMGPTLPLTPPPLSGTGSAAVRVTDRSRRSPSTHRCSGRGSGRRGETARRRCALPCGERTCRRGDSRQCQRLSTDRHGRALRISLMEGLKRGGERKKVNRWRSSRLLLLGGAELLLAGRPRAAPTRCCLCACKSTEEEKEWG
jgi:hypothetical protein